MISFASRPSPNMECKDNVYYPAGFPATDDPGKTAHWIRYIDKDYQSFWIRYTEKQMMEEVRKRGAFYPYIPLLYSSRPTE